MIKRCNNYINYIFRTPDQDFHWFDQCEIILSHIPTHTRSSDHYESLLLEKSVPHRYPCEISATNTRWATCGRLLMWDNIFGALLYSFENESWIVVSQEKNPCWIFSDLSRPSTWFKSKTVHFYLQPLFNALNTPSDLRLTYFICCVRQWATESTGMEILDDVKKHTLIFLNKITYWSYCGW